MASTAQRNECGATAVEYALLLTFIAIVIVTSVGLFGASVAQLFVAQWPW